MRTIPNPKMSDILREEFLEPLNLSALAVARQIYLPTAKMQAVLQDKSPITADVSIRLGRFFGVSDDYFLSL